LSHVVCDGRVRKQFSAEKSVQLKSPKAKTL
jgi:hypothetical protein